MNLKKVFFTLKKHDLFTIYNKARALCYLKKYDQAFDIFTYLQSNGYNGEDVNYGVNYCKKKIETMPTSKTDL